MKTIKKFVFAVSIIAALAFNAYANVHQMQWLGQDKKPPEKVKEQPKPEKKDERRDNDRKDDKKGEKKKPE